MIRFEAARKRLGHAAVLTADQVLGLPVGNPFETAVAYAAAVRGVFLSSREEGWPDPATPNVDLYRFHPEVSHTTCTGNSVLWLVLQKRDFSVGLERPNNLVVTEGAPFDREIDGDPVVVALLGDATLRAAGASFLVNDFGVDSEAVRSMVGHSVTRHENVVGRYGDHWIVGGENPAMFRVYEHPDESGMTPVADELAFRELIINSFGCPEVTQTLLERLALQLGTTVEARRAEINAEHKAAMAGRLVSSVRRVRAAA